MVTDTLKVQAKGLENNFTCFGCDGTSVNIAPAGLRGHLEESVPWAVVFWFFAHRVELALKDAFTDTLLSDEMILRVYYL